MFRHRRSLEAAAGYWIEAAVSLNLKKENTMRVTQGAFSFLPDLSDQQIKAQVEYCLRNNWAVSVEYTDDIHPRNT